jgi:2-(1,2-epoxy-1,2-dihydrophenyl)acetyl-CoA isomerase
MGITVAVDGAVAVVTIEQPSRRNAMTLEMRAQAQREFERLCDDPEVRAIVLTGAGEHFSAGADVSDMGQSGVGGSILKMRYIHRMVRAVNRTEKPVIAAVRGVCIGMSWSLALACDFVIAAVDARFQFAFRHLGLAPDGGAVFQLTRLVGLQRAKEIIYSGRFVSGSEARSLGLALEALPADEVLSRALAFAGELALAPTTAIAMAKRQFDAAPAQTLDQALDFEGVMQAAMINTDDFREGAAAFREKRKPSYVGR